MFKSNFMLAFFSFLMMALTNQRGEIDPGTGKEKVEPELDADGNPIVPGAKLDKDGKPIVEKPGALDVKTLPKEAQDLIASLRKEAADNRTKKKASDDRLARIEKALGIEAEDEAPEAKLSKVTSENEELKVRAAYQEIAMDHGISKEQFKYFSFLMNDAVAELGEDEEMTEEQLESIVEEAKAKAPVTKPANTTSVNGQGVGGKGPKKDDTVTAEQFKKMGIIARSKLFQQNPDLYNSLMSQVGV